MKWIKRIGIGIISLPFILILAVILFEIFGMYVNHNATNRQTKELQANLENNITDIEIIDVYSETGNTSGTGNHVDCLSIINFTTEMTKDEIESALLEYYEFDEWGCSIEIMENGIFSFELCTSAPFPDNIEGH